LIAPRVRRLLASPWCAYLGIAALQLKVMWGAWVHRDLTHGDTVAYFVYGTWWAEGLQVNLVWSPLYTAFYGTLIAIFPDAYTSTTLHRLLIAVGASLLVLALMRQLLPAWLAWLVAAWWALLRINFDTFSEVHLFAVLPVLAAFWVVAAWPGPRGRGLGLGLLLLAALVSRNEMIFPFLGLGTLFLWEQLRRPGVGGRERLRALRTAGLAVAAALTLFVFFYARSRIQFPELWKGYGPKHTVNMCQVFATGYQQRHPEWTKNPMIECAELMEAHFGASQPTLRQMVRANPRAVLEHFAWNASLTPSGLQLMLFDAAAGRTTPDYTPVPLGSRRSFWLSVLSLALLAAAAAIVWTEARWRRLLRRRSAVWVFMLGTTLPLAVVVILTQRPRPSYLFSLTAVLMAALGLSAAVVLRRVFGKRDMGRITLAAALALLVLVPRHYDRSGPFGRVLMNIYRRVSLVQDLVARYDAVVMVRGYSVEIAHYVGGSRARAVDYAALRGTSDQELLDSLAAAGVNVFYVDEPLLAALGPRSLFRGRPGPARRAGWRLVGQGDEARGGWRLWARSEYVDAVRGRPAVGAH
jgi:hypothetical protein